jgi:hypothetical protein
MNKHTPGPWAVSDISRDMIYDLNGELLALIIDGESDETKLANACLIAAAPDLLEALKESLKEFLFDCYDDHPSAKRWRTAIAKATGETE